MKTQITMYMVPGSGPDVSVSVHPDGEAHVRCSAYEHRLPIMSILHADVHVTVSPASDEADADDLSFARDLFQAARTYLTEIERHRAGESAGSPEAA